MNVTDRVGSSHPAIKELHASRFQPRRRKTAKARTKPIVSGSDTGRM
jgi:hypothetical protein